MGLKAEDCKTIPLTPEQHVLLHDEVPKYHKEGDWLAIAGCQFVLLLAERLWRNTGDYEACCWIIEGHRR